MHCCMGSFATHAGGRGLFAPSNIVTRLRACRGGTLTIKVVCTFFRLLYFFILDQKNIAHNYISDNGQSAGNEFNFKFLRKTRGLSGEGSFVWILEFIIKVRSSETTCYTPSMVFFWGEDIVQFIVERL
uniref:Uncharacterized protein n=1 Tax=Morchella brunnea TaxID=1174671 RepID=A0A8K1I7X9_9PEZI|nr:hypothetical protein LK370_mgp042 [Morchella brunnea]UBU98588.1 hypothetical protein [Morchella brunnea]